MHMSQDMFDFTHTGGNRLPETSRENARTITETTDAPQNSSTPYTVSPGDTFNGSLYHGAEEDWVRIELTEGVTYTVSMIAGTMSDPYLWLIDSAGIVIETDDDSGLGNNAQIVFTPTASGTYYIVAGTASGGFGGGNDTGTYSVTVNIGEPPPGGGDPLNAITWGYTAPSTINVYFVPGGVTFDDEHGAPQITSDWSAAEQAQAMAAFGTFEDVANVHFNVVTDAAEADFFMVESTDSGSAPGYWSVAGGTVTLDGTTYSDLDGFGVFYGNDPGWTEEGLQQGGAGFATLLQGIGLGMGLAYPHDDGGASNVMQGVSAPGDYGDADLNQGVFTMMSNNHGWPAGPDGAGASSGHGYQGAPMALDIAVLQSLYGANNSHNSGDDIYVLPSANEAGTFYSSIWDTGGTDTIMYTGSDAAVIDLRTASLDYIEGGGGYVSYVEGVQGGFTIADGVWIDRAVGGRGNDTITGNILDNWIEGHGGDDIILGGDGWDTIIGGYGDDTVTGGDGQDYFVFVKGHNTLTITDYNPQTGLIGFSDHIVLAGFGDNLTTASDLLPFVSQVGSDVVISGNGQTIVIEDTSLYNLTADDVIFV